MCEKVEEEEEEGEEGRRSRQCECVGFVRLCCVAVSVCVCLCVCVCVRERERERRREMTVRHRGTNTARRSLSTRSCEQCVHADHSVCVKEHAVEIHTHRTNRVCANNSRWFLL